MIYTHVMNKGGRGVKSPLDAAGGPPRTAEEPGATYLVAARRAGRAVDAGGSETGNGKPSRAKRRFSRSPFTIHHSPLQ